MKRHCLVFLFCCAAATAQPSVHYSLSMPQPWNHLFIVEMTISGIHSSGIDVSMAAWRTGRYMILDFSGEVQEFSVHDADRHTLPFSKTDKDTWHIANGRNETIIVSYKVYANEKNLRTRELNSDHAFIDPSAIFLYVDPEENTPVSLTIHPYGSWHVTTGMKESPDAKNTFTAPNFQYLIDSPIEIGNQKDYEFWVENKKHIISIYGDGNWNSDTLIQDFTKLIIANKEFWGALPYDTYIFILHCQPNAGGATEHINSAVIGTRPFVFAHKDSYQRFLDLVSHEYFHTWNVKQLRPKAIAPYDLSKEAYTKELWISEGMTDYYGKLMLVDAGLMTAPSFINSIPAMISSDRSRYGNTIQPLSESSFDAWVKFWKGLQNSYNAQSDYYGKGDAVSLLLDLEIRHRTHNNASLHTVMKNLYHHYSPTHGFTNEDFIAECEQVSGTKFTQFFQKYLYGTAPLPWEEILAYAGLEVRLKDSSGHVGIGVFFSRRNQNTSIRNIIPGSPADSGHLEVQDEIIALNGFRISPSDLDDRIADMAAGDTVTLSIFRNDKLLNVPIVLASLPSTAYTIKKTEKPSALQKAIYESWMHEPF